MPQRHRQKLQTNRLLSISDAVIKIHKTYSYMFVLHIPNTLNYTSAYRIAKIFGVGLGVDISKVYSAVQLGPRNRHGSESLIRRAIISGKTADCKRSTQGREGREVHSTERAKLLGSMILCGRRPALLLRLGYICTSVFAVIDSLPSPCGLCRKSCNNLHTHKLQIRDSQQ